MMLVDYSHLISMIAYSLENKLSKESIINEIVRMNDVKETKVPNIVEKEYFLFLQQLEITEDENELKQYIKHEIETQPTVEEFLETSVLCKILALLYVQAILRKKFLKPRFKLFKWIKQVIKGD